MTKGFGPSPRAIAILRIYLDEVFTGLTRIVAPVDKESTKRRCGVLLARALPRARRRDARAVVEVVFRLTVALSATLAERPADGEEARRLVAIHVDMVTCYLDQLRAADRGDRA